MTKYIQKEKMKVHIKILNTAPKAFFSTSYTVVCPETGVSTPLDWQINSKISMDLPP